MTEEPLDQTNEEALPEEQDPGVEAEQAEETVESVAEASPQAAGAIEALAVEEPLGMSWTPFLVYLAAWVVLCVGVVVFFRPAALEGGARWAPEYLYAAYAGIGMTALGPVLSLVAWLVTRSRREAVHRHGLFASALVKGAVVTFTGALLWIVSLYLLDVFASGRLV